MFITIFGHGIQTFFTNNILAHVVHIGEKFEKGVIYLFTQSNAIKNSIQPYIVRDFNL